MGGEARRDLEAQLTDLLNGASAENASNTPDFILAQYLLGCLDAFNAALRRREAWYGRTTTPSRPPSGSVEDAAALDVLPGAALEGEGAS